MAGISGVVSARWDFGWIVSRDEVEVGFTASVAELISLWLELDTTSVLFKSGWSTFNNSFGSSFLITERLMTGFSTVAILSAALAVLSNDVVPTSPV